MAANYQLFLISSFINSQPILLQDLDELMHSPLEIINIKYLLSAKSLLQRLNLVHLQFLKQRTDLGMEGVGRVNEKGEIQKDICTIISKNVQLSFQPKAGVAGKFYLGTLCARLGTKRIMQVSKKITMSQTFAEFGS